MKIAFVCFAFNDYSIVHVNALAEEHDVLLVLPMQEVQKSETKIDRKVNRFLPEMPRLRQPIRNLWIILKIVRQIRQFDPDIIHYQHGHLWFNMALPTLRRYPLVVTVHDPRHHLGDEDSKRTPQALMDFGFRRADRIIVHGEMIAKEVQRKVGVPRERIEVVSHIALGGPNGSGSCEEDEKSVLFFGRVWEYKGLRYLIEAEPMISEEVEGVEITIAGEGEDMDRYRELMLNPDHFVIHDRWINNDERSELFCRSAVVVLPYVEATQSGVVPVAYSYGKPVVATTVGSLPEYVDHGRTGFLVPPRDARALADAVVHLLQDRGLRHTMGEAGHRTLIEKSAPAAVARDTVEVYLKTLENQRRS